jgi:hypothetical protein
MSKTINGSGVLAGRTGGWKDVVMDVEVEVEVFMLMGCFVLDLVGLGLVMGS